MRIHKSSIGLSGNQKVDKQSLLDSRSSVVLIVAYVVFRQVLQHGGPQHVGVTHLVIGEDGKVEGGNGGDDLLFELLAHRLVKCMLGEGGCILVVGFGDLGTGRVARMERGGAGMDRDVERLANLGEVFGGWHDYGEVAMGTTTSGRVNGMGVGIKLTLEEL